MNRTDIQWTWTQNNDGTWAKGSTWNPLVGCRRVSPGCEHCYAERLISTRLKHLPMYRGLARFTNNGPRFTGEHRLITDRLGDPLRTRKGRRIFVNDMGDLFYEGHAFEEIAAVFGVMATAQQHTYQVLTKRAKRMAEFFAWLANDADGPVAAACLALQDRIGLLGTRGKWAPDGTPWPLPNVWLGVSVEDQRRGEERIPHLLATPAAVRFLSIEPLLGPVDLAAIRYRDEDADVRVNALTGESWIENSDSPSAYSDDGPRLGWVIVGGESGPGARPFDLAWARDLRDQCRASGTAFFMKQIGARPEGDYADDAQWPDIHDSHGGDPSEWPTDLRVREFPTVRRG